MGVIHPIYPDGPDGSFRRVDPEGLTLFNEGRSNWPEIPIFSHHFFFKIIK